MRNSINGVGSGAQKQCDVTGVQSFEVEKIG
jgi:hypothetical protein